MIIYDDKTKKIYVPENDDYVGLDAKDVYELAFRTGYEKGYDDGLADCNNS